MHSCSSMHLITLIADSESPERCWNRRQVATAGSRGAGYFAGLRVCLSFPAIHNTSQLTHNTTMARAARLVVAACALLLLVARVSAQTPRNDGERAPPQQGCLTLC